MIKLRTEGGKAKELPPEYKFIEICDNDGGLGRLIYTDEGIIKELNAGDELFEKYVKLFGLTKTKFIRIPSHVLSTR